MQVIRDNGSIDKAVNELKSVIEQVKEDKKEHGKEYKKGKETVLAGDIKTFAEKL
jgi:predicted RNase H-like HicB family nuclease